MSKLFIVSSTIAVLITAWMVSSQGDSTPSLPTIADVPGTVPEPITGTAVMPRPGSETQQRDPFTPYDPGPPEALWRYEQLSTAEKAVVDRGRDTTAWRGIHGAYGAAVRERVPALRAQAAASQLGAHDLPLIGVVR